MITQAVLDKLPDTPMWGQYKGIKKDALDALLFYRMGDFYELFLDDAVETSAIVGITLTARNKNEGMPIPMCGVPVHAAEAYLARLIRQGFRVAVCEQMEDPAEAKKRGGKAPVKRAVIRIVTPGTLTEENLLDARRHNYLAALADASLRLRKGGASVEPIKIEVQRQRSTIGGQHAAGFMAVFGVFFLTLLLAGQAVGTMAEERSNKVIEVLAAAVPLESVFFGKLIGMFGSAVLFILFWGTIAAQIGHVLPPDAAAAARELAPAVGWPAFVVLFCLYFTMAYLLLGAVFLTIGAQASTIREIQMLSLPITFTQIGMFALASAGAAHPGGWVAILAEVFPLSSPFAMAARAANTAGLWPHLVALIWQALWVSVVISLGARWFRRGVLKSGGPRRKSKTRDAAAVAGDAVGQIPY